MPEIVVWPKIILDIALWVKSKMASISARLSYKLPSFSTEWTQKHNFGVIGFSGMPDIVKWFEITLDIALWVKFKMAAIYKKHKLI